MILDPDLIDAPDIAASVLAAMTPNGRLRRQARKAAMFKRMYGGPATGPLTPEEAFNA